MHKKREFYILSLLTWAFVIGLWFIATNFGLVGTTLLPSPQRVISAFFDLIENGYNSTAFYVQLELSGLGRIGSNPLSLLKRSIQGYSLISNQDDGAGFDD